VKSSKAAKGTATLIYTDRIGTVPVTSGANQNLRGTTGTASQIAVAQGFWSKGDGGGGVFYWDTTTTNRDDGGTYIVPNTNAPDPYADPPTLGSQGAGWKRIYSGPVNVQWFGAKGDGNYTETDSTRIQNAINAAEAASLPYDPGAGAPAQWSYPAIVFPPGNYVLQAGLVTSIGFLRVVGLGNANLIRGTGFPTTDPSTPAWKINRPFQLSFEGLSFSGFPTNRFPIGLELGASDYNVATASVHLVRCNFYNCATGLKYGSRSSTLTLDYCKFKANIKHIEISRCDLIHLNHCHFNEFYPAASGHVAIEVGTGRIHVYGSSFTPGDINLPLTENAWIGIYDTFYTPTPEDGGSHIGLVAHGVRAGGENGGLTFVNYDAAPADPVTSRLAITRILIRDSQVDPGQGNNGRPACVVRLWQAPNHLEITGCHWALGRPVDWSASVPDPLPDPPPPELHLRADAPDTPLIYRVEGNCYEAKTRHWIPAGFEAPVRNANIISGLRRGTSTIPRNSLGVTVDLGLPDNLPTNARIRLQDISVTPVSSLGAASSWWVELTGDDQFDIRLNTTLGSPAEFAWSVDLGRY
jgi:hypothetical protein